MWGSDVLANHAAQCHSRADLTPAGLHEAHLGVRGDRNHVGVVVEITGDRKAGPHVHVT